MLSFKVLFEEQPQHIFHITPYFLRVKCLTWKRIMIRHREDISLDGQDGSIDESVASLRKFTGFDEAIFDPHGNRGNHMDLGQLYQFQIGRAHV